MRNPYEVRAEKFIHQIYGYIHGCRTWRQFEIAVSKFNMDYGRKVRFAHGLTRVCFITSDYVVKYNFGSDRNLVTFGTNADEIATYKLAEEANFSYLFAKPTLVSYMATEFCIMPRVYGIGRYDEDANEFLTEEENEWVMEHVGDLHNHNYGWKGGRPLIFDYACN